MPEQLGRVYLGLTDEEAPGPIPDVPEPTPEEVAFLLDTVNTALQTALTTADVTGRLCGFAAARSTRGRAGRRICRGTTRCWNRTPACSASSAAS